MADGRLWLGAALVVASMAAGAMVVNAGNDTVMVLRATRDLPVGSAPTDLAPVAVTRAVADSYVVGAVPAGRVLRWPVQAGDLLPASALTEPDVQPLREVTVPVDPLHAPMELAMGDRVDVWVSPRLDARDAATPRRVLTDVAVVTSAADRVGLGGEVAVVLAVPETEVPDLVLAARSGVVDLVAVPLGGQPT
jgi:hypothetical protein